MNHRPFLLLLVLTLALLPACGPAVPEVVPTTAATTQAPTTTEPETTTEAPTTTRITITGSGITYKVLDLEDRKNASIKAWLDGWFKEFNREKEYAPETLLEESVVDQLLEQIREDHEYLFSENSTYPRCTALDDRFVFIDWIDYKWLIQQEIYDKQEKKSISFSALPFRAVTPIAVVNDTVYMGNMNDDGPYYEHYCGELNLLTYNLKDLRQGKPFKGKDLLADIPHEPASGIWMYQLTEGERFFIVSDVYGLRVFDLKTKNLALQLSAMLIDIPGNVSWYTLRPGDKNLGGHFAWRNGKLYWFPIEWLGNPGNLCRPYGNNIIEITLP